MGLPAGGGVLSAGGSREDLWATHLPPHGPLPEGGHDQVTGASICFFLLLQLFFLRLLLLPLSLPFAFLGIATEHKTGCDEVVGKVL